MRKRRLESLKATAYHEAGHAVMAFLLGIPFKHVTIVPEENTTGHLQHRRSPKWFHPDIDSNGARARQRIEAHIRIFFAGGIAEKKLKGRRRAPHWTVRADRADNSNAVEMAFDVCGSPKAAKHYLAWLYEEALWTLDAHWNLVEEIAANLLDNKHLTAQQVRVAIDRAIEK